MRYFKKHTKGWVAENTGQLPSSQQLITVGVLSIGVEESLCFTPPRIYRLKSLQRQALGIF